jgi:hypothetical protein
VLRDASLRRELGARGAERAKRFGWDASARTMAEVLRDAR